MSPITSSATTTKLVRVIAPPEYACKFATSVASHVNALLWFSEQNSRQGLLSKKSTSLWRRRQIFMHKMFPINARRMFEVQHKNFYGVPTAESLPVSWGDLWYNQKEPYIELAQQHQTKFHNVFRQNRKNLSVTAFQVFRDRMVDDKVFDFVPNASMFAALPVSVRVSYQRKAMTVRRKAKAYFKMVDNWIAGERLKRLLSKTKQNEREKKGRKRGRAPKHRTLSKQKQHRKNKNKNRAKKNASKKTTKKNKNRVAVKTKKRIVKKLIQKKKKKASTKTKNLKNVYLKRRKTRSVAMMKKRK
eukprot:PhM_4_TR2899/c0_g1_i1/m.101531